MRITGQESGPILRGWLQADKLFGLNTYANAKCTGSNKATQLWLYCSASGSQCRNQASKAQPATAMASHENHVAGVRRRSSEIAPGNSSRHSAGFGNT